MPCSKYKGRQRRMCYATKEWTQVKQYKRKGKTVKAHKRKL